MDNHNHQQCGKLEFLKSKAQIEYDQHKKGGSSNPPLGHSPPTPPGVPQGAPRLKYETDKTSNSDANNSNNYSITSYYDYTAYDVFICSLLSSLLDPHQHEISRTIKACQVNEVDISYNFQFIL